MRCWLCSLTQLHRKWSWLHPHVYCNKVNFALNYYNPNCVTNYQNCNWRDWRRGSRWPDVEWRSRGRNMTEERKQRPCWLHWLNLPRKEQRVWSCNFSRMIYSCSMWQTYFPAYQGPHQTTLWWLQLMHSCLWMVGMTRSVGGGTVDIFLKLFSRMGCWEYPRPELGIERGHWQKTLFDWFRLTRQSFKLLTGQLSPLVWYIRVCFLL